MSVPIMIGTAGWSVSSRYIQEISLGGSHLQRYARHLNAVEINSSFYRPHRYQTYLRWAQSTPSNFRFAVKIPKAISHDRGLLDCGALLKKFSNEIDGLGNKLGVILLQLPPKLGFNKIVAGRFFGEVKHYFSVPIACEPRNATWFTQDVDHFLSEYCIARVAADPAPVSGADKLSGWVGLAYYRWHGSPQIYYSDYDDAALGAIERRIQAQLHLDIPMWFIFDNTASGAALGNALNLAKRVLRA